MNIFNNIPSIPNLFQNHIQFLYHEFQNQIKQRYELSTIISIGNISLAIHAICIRKDIYHRERFDHGPHLRYRLCR